MNVNSHMIVRMQLKDIEGFEVGQQLSLTEMFKEGDFIDVAGKSVGKGFQGRFRFSKYATLWLP